MSKFLIVFATTDGHTRRICLRLQELIEMQQHQVTLSNVDSESPCDLNAFDKIIIGASVRYGKHSHKIHQFIEENSPILNNKANAFFSVNLVARKPEKSKPETNPYLHKFLQQIAWKPKQLAVFAGKIEYPKYNFFDRTIIRLIMWMTKGPTDPKAIIEFTNWRQVEDFARVMSES